MSKKIVFVMVIALLIVSLGVFADNATVKYGGILRTVVDWGPLAFNLNPLGPNGLPVMPEIYESLFFPNIMTGEMIPVLGVSYKWGDQNLKLIVETRKGVEWSDGVPFTARDVAFTFNYIKRYPALDESGIWSPLSYLKTVEASGENTVVFTFSKPNLPLLVYIASQYIVPEHIWTNIEDPAKWINPNPVGTGPFLFKSFDAQNSVTTLIKNPNYWMKNRPYIDEILVGSVNSDSMALLELLKHDIDWVYLYIPDVQKTFADRDPSINKFWWPVGNIYVLYLNTLKYPFNLATFRKAISIAIDKQACEEKAYFNIGGVANPTGILPTQMKEWFDPTLSAAASELNSYNPQKAQELLASIGFKKNPAGQLCDPQGNPLPTFKIIVGAGWTDYITMAQIISQNLKVLGIDTIVEQQAMSTYMSSVMTATYDMAICWGVPENEITPYYLYYWAFNPAFSAAEIGKTAISDWSRYTNPLITSALQVYAQTEDINIQKEDLYTIEGIILKEVPFIPLAYACRRDNFSEYRFTGWPSAEDPYCDGSAISMLGGRIVTLNVHLK
jgi:peptide/nickel transport system substrate-binding protein